MEDPKEGPPPLPDTKRTLLRPSEPPKPANQFFYTVLGDSIQLDISHVDLVEARAAFETIKTGAQADLPVYVTDRFILTPEAALNLLMAAKDLVATLRSFGKLPKVEEDAAVEH